MLKALKKKITHNPKLVAALFNWYRPFRGAGIQIQHISDDFRQITVDMPLTRGNKNIMGTHFGGSLYAMADPFFMYMLMQNLGARYHVWDQTAFIEFVKPGDGLVRGVFQLTQSDIDSIEQLAAGGDKVLHEFNCNIVKLDGTVVARVKKVLYIRLKRQHRPQ